MFFAMISPALQSRTFRPPYVRPPMKKRGPKSAAGKRELQKVSLVGRVMKALQRVC